jgi:CDP-diglyceride synthetase
MQSGAVVATSITSLIGFLLNSTILALVLSRGRKLYHYLFSGFLFICAMWDLGIFLSMIRNSHVNELPIYGKIIWWPCVFMFAIIFHFTCAYLNQPRKKRTIFLWVFSGLIFILGVSGLGGKIIGVYNYSWGNIFRPDSMLLAGNLVGLPIVYFFGISALLFLFRAYQRERSSLRKRHILYILISFAIIHLALAKVAILYGIDNSFLMPTCMFLNDIAAALVGIAIIKYRLLDITVIIKKTTIYSALAAIIIFVFGVSEHLLSTYVGQLLGEQSMYIHIISIAAVVAVFMPVRGRLERAIERAFAQKKVKF